jgi:ubiquinone/menaquinone biosynthesis C-methylase UbiE
MLSQLTRYGPVMQMVEATPGRVLLDVGSGSQGVGRYASSRWRITACDLDFSDYGSTDSVAARGERVQASVLDLPFADQSFDVVVALDLLEHVAQVDRPRALAELARVGRRRVVVGCPCGSRALEADRRLARLYDRLRLPRPPWLDEHLVNGFPEAGELSAGLNHAGRVRLVDNEWLLSHQLLVGFEALPYVGLLARAAARALRPGVSGEVGRRADLARGLLRFVRGGDRAPAYRVIALVDVP